MATAKKSVKKSASAKKVPAASGKSGKSKTPAAKPAAGKPAAEKTAGVPKLSAAQQKKLKELLLEMRGQLQSQITALKDDSLKRADEVNTVEDGTDAFERQFALNIASSEHESMLEIDEALRRLSEGAYGVCEQCGGGIESARLQALPFVRMCIGCQSALEKSRAPYRQTAVRRVL